MPPDPKGRRPKRKHVDAHRPYRFRKKPARSGAALAFVESALATESDSCIEFPFARNADGYGRMWVGRKHVYAHVIACERAHGPKQSPEHQVAHSCRTPACVNKRHLRWATPVENAADKIEHGTTYGTKLDPPDAKFIGKELAHVMRFRDIARMFNVSGSTISEIVRRLPTASDDDGDDAKENAA